MAVSVQELSLAKPDSRQKNLPLEWGEIPLPIEKETELFYCNREPTGSTQKRRAMALAFCGCGDRTERKRERLFRGK